MLQWSSVCVWNHFREPLAGSLEDITSGAALSARFALSLLTCSRPLTLNWILTLLHHCWGAIRWTFSFSFPCVAVGEVIVFAFYCSCVVFLFPFCISVTTILFSLYYGYGKSIFSCVLHICDTEPLIIIIMKALRGVTAFIHSFQHNYKHKSGTYVCLFHSWGKLHLLNWSLLYYYVLIRGSGLILLIPTTSERAGKAVPFKQDLAFLHKRRSDLFVQYLNFIPAHNKVIACVFSPSLIHLVKVHVPFCFKNRKTTFLCAC